jgi:hypothetical protein
MSASDYKVEFEPDWKRYPKLASIFEPRVNVYWEELRSLLVEARADAVRYVSDVKMEELAKARAEERARLRGAVNQAREAIAACEREDADPCNDYGDVGETLEECEAALRRFVAEVEAGESSTESAEGRSPPEMDTKLVDPTALVALREGMMERAANETYSKFREALAAVRSTYSKEQEIAVSVRSLTYAQLLQALKNVGCDLSCDACAEIFFTGSKMHDHTCLLQ